MTRLPLLLVALLVLVPSQELPPPYPRAGVTMMLENEDLVVWDISWLKQAYPVHRHRWDLAGVYYTSGDRVIVSTEGERRPVHTDAWNTAFQRSGVTHSEEGASDEPLRAVFVELKRAEAFGSATGPGAAFPTGSPTQRVDNDRVTIWEYGTSHEMPRGPHHHVHDAVVVSFGASDAPQARFVRRGTSHDSDAVQGATRTFVIEIK